MLDLKSINNLDVHNIMEKIKNFVCYVYICFNDFVKKQQTHIEIEKIENSL